MRETEATTDTEEVKKLIRLKKRSCDRRPPKPLVKGGGIMSRSLHPDELARLIHVKKSELRHLSILHGYAAALSAWIDCGRPIGGKVSDLKDNNLRNVFDTFPPDRAATLVERISEVVVKGAITCV